MSKYFNLKELTRSATAINHGINNEPSKEVISNLEHLMTLLDKVRELWGKPLIVNSGYRCVELNKRVGGAINSNHLKGEAADITTGNKEGNLRLFELIKNSDLIWDELIDEKKGKWIHIAYRKANNRQKVLRL